MAIDVLNKEVIDELERLQLVDNEIYNWSLREKLRGPNSTYNIGSNEIDG